MKHWVFDLDGTLVDSSKFYDHSISKMLKKHGIEVTDDDIAKAYKYFNPKEFFDTYFEDKMSMKVTQEFLDYNFQFVPEIRLFEGIKETLFELQKKEVKISVWTGRETAVAKKILECTGLLSMMSHCVGRTCIAKNKPNPDGLIKIINDSKNTSDEMIMIGDHAYDMQGAKSAKVRGISVTWDPKFDHGCQHLSEKHFTRVSDLHNWIKNL